MTWLARSATATTSASRPSATVMFLMTIGPWYLASERRTCAIGVRCWAQRLQCCGELVEEAGGPGRRIAGVRRVAHVEDVEEVVVADVKGDQPGGAVRPEVTDRVVDLRTWVVDA
jgi:hypothetical protein